MVTEYTPETLVTLAEAAAALRCGQATLRRHKGEVTPAGERKVTCPGVLYRFGDLKALLQRIRERAEKRDPNGFLFQKPGG